MRGRIFQAFEAAELEQDRARQTDWLTFVVVGAGPTGVEMAGQIADLARDTLPGEFRDSDPRASRVLLVETPDRVLSAFPASLSRRAARRGRCSVANVVLLLGHTVVNVRPDGVDVQTDEGNTTRIQARTIVWAGVTASLLARALSEASGADIDRSGRVTVEPDLTLPGHPEVLAIGDIARVRDARTGEPQTLPRLAPVAMQQGRYAGRLISDRVAGRATPPFHSRDKGTLDHRARQRGRQDPQGEPQRTARMADLAGGASVFSDRLREPGAGPAALGLQLLHSRARDAADHRSRRAAPMAALAAKDQVSDAISSELSRRRERPLPGVQPALPVPR